MENNDKKKELSLIEKETELVEVSAQLESVQEESKKKDDNIAAHNEAIDLSTAKINSLEEANNQLRLKVQQITDAAKKFKVNNDLLKNEIKKEKAKPKANKVSNDPNLLSSKIEELQDKLVESAKSIKDKNKEINRLKEDNKSLGTQLAKAKDKDDENKTETNDKLIKLQASLKANKNA